MLTEELKLLELLVPKAGIEPARGDTPPDFESGASACSTTSACLILRGFAVGVKPAPPWNVTNL